MLQNKIMGFIATISVLETGEEMKDWYNIKEEIHATLKQQLRLFKSEIRKVIESVLKLVYVKPVLMLIYNIVMLYIFSLKRFDNIKIMYNISSPH